MEEIKMTSTKPKIAVFWILDTKKLSTVKGLKEFVDKAKKVIHQQNWELTEFGPTISQDEIADKTFSIQGQYDAVLGVTFHGTSAKQTANLAQFRGVIGTWFFPETEWWSMASSGSGQGYIRDEAEVNSGIKHIPIYASPDSEEIDKQLDRFASVAHTIRAMRQEKIVLVGDSYIEVMPASNWHPDILTNRLGPRFAEISIVLLQHVCEEITDNQVMALLNDLQSKHIEMPPDEVSLSTIKQAARVSLAIEKLQIKEQCTGLAVNCYGSPDPEGYTGIMGCCGANPCLKGHACDSVIIGCESDVVQCAQQMLFRHLTGKIPCMADPWKLNRKTGELLSGTCSGPLSLAKSNGRKIARGTLMSLYKVGVIGGCFPDIDPAQVIIARIAGRNLDKMILMTGEFLGCSTEIIPGRLCLISKIENPDIFLQKGVSGNHYTFLPTNDLKHDLSKLELLCDFMGIEIIQC